MKAELVAVGQSEEERWWRSTRGRVGILRIPSAKDSRFTNSAAYLDVVDWSIVAYISACAESSCWKCIRSDSE
jgi:hypothetical protein